MSEHPIKVTATTHEGQRLIECSDCGVLGVANDREVAKAISADHMRTKHLVSWVVVT